MKYLFSITLFFLMFKSYGQVEDTIQADMKKEIRDFLMKEDINKFENEYLPQFTLPDLEGNGINSETLKGKPTVIDLWFTACVPCIEKIPMLNEIERRYDNKVNFIAITYQDSTTIKSFLKKKHFNFFHLVNSKEYLKTFGFFGYPKMMILDENLKIIRIFGKIQNNIQSTDVDKSIEFKNRIIKLLDTLVLNIEPKIKD